MTGEDIVIKSNNFNVDKNGNLVCKNASIIGGIIRLSSENQNNPKLITTDANNSSIYATYGPWGQELYKGGTKVSTITQTEGDNGYYGATLYMKDTLGNYGSLGYDAIKVRSTAGNSSSMTASTVSSQNFDNNSLFEMKENIEKIENENIIDLIKNTDICKFNYKGQKQQNIGLIIGGGFNTPNEVLNQEKNSINLYSMISLAWKAVQELTEKVENLENKSKEDKADG